MEEEEIVIAAQRIGWLLRVAAALTALAALALLARFAWVPH